MWLIEIISLNTEINDTGTLNRVLPTTSALGNGVVRSLGDEVITFVPGLNCGSSRKSWVNKNGCRITKMVDFENEDGIFWSFSAVWQEKKIYGEIFRHRENIWEIGSAGSCCSNREPLDQIERVEMFAIIKITLPYICLYNWTGWIVVISVVLEFLYHKLK